MWETAARLLLLSAAAVAAAAAAIATEGDAIPQLTSVEASSTPPATPPHILFIVVDDHGYSDCGYTGRSFIRTPTIDSFASEGVVLENMYVQKVCTADTGGGVGSPLLRWLRAAHLSYPQAR